MTVKQITQLQISVIHIVDISETELQICKLW